MAIKKRRAPRDLRYRDKCFPNAEAQVFNPKKTSDSPGGGYAPLPYITRELMRYLQNSDLRVWLYMLTRAGQYCICYPTYEELLEKTGLRSKGTISKAIHRLEKLGLISTYNDRGTRRYLLRDPRLCIEKMFHAGGLSAEALEDVNDILEAIGHSLIEPQKKQAAAPARPAKAPQGAK